jgi:hypothetical protein
LELGIRNLVWIQIVNHAYKFCMKYCLQVEDYIRAYSAKL